MPPFSLAIRPFHPVQGGMPNIPHTSFPPQAIVLFSGGLDSILAAKVLEEQGLRVRCLHCHSPFFGEPSAVPRWRKRYALDIDTLDVADDFCAMLRERPAHGFGKTLNPCVDCKILLLRRARQYMENVGAAFLVTGEVLGQRPMSQRRDVLNVIRREAGVGDILLRPLSAPLLAPTPMEESGLVDRERLPAISGRGRQGQLQLARHFGLADIPTPGGGCKLTEKENARRYWPVLAHLPAPDSGDFALANLGRQFWHEEDGRRYWLAVGRNSGDNQALQAATRPGDARIFLADIPGPLAVGRLASRWPEHILAAAAALMASYSGRAVREAGEAGSVGVRAQWHTAEGRTDGWQGRVMPARKGIWQEPQWEPAREAIRAEQKIRLHGAPCGPQPDGEEEEGAA